MNILYFLFNTTVELLYNKLSYHGISLNILYDVCTQVTDIYQKLKEVKRNLDEISLELSGEQPLEH